MAYVDGFLLAVPKKNLAKYRAMAKKAGKIWMEHGALSYVTYKNRKDRDRVVKAVKSDPRLDGMKNMPFDGKRMMWGGFKAIIEM